MLNATLSLDAATEFLSVADQHRLISDAQDVPLHVLVDADGTERVIHGSTPASERALEAITRAFLPAVHRAARVAKIIDTEEAVSVALAELIAAVRRHDLAGELPFAAVVSNALRWAVQRADRGSDLVQVKDNVAARYWRLVHTHNFDIDAAYRECRDTANGMDPHTFLAVHRAVSTAESIDAASGDDSDSTQALMGAIEAAVPVHGPEERAVMRDLVSWLFSLVDDRQEAILRARFGFRDLATEMFLVEYGLHLGSVLSDVQVAEVLGIGRATVQREKTKALATMRAALEAEDAAA